jgi:rhamnogalacturonyl hydrolase YesR
VPPFLAYYGVVQNNQSLVQEAYNQCKLYRDVLRVESSGLWQHILLGTENYDPGLWATGNAWAAQGMLRVLATIKWSQFAGQMQSQMNDLQAWTEEIVNGCRRYVVSVCFGLGGARGTRSRVDIPV